MYVPRKHKDYCNHNIKINFTEYKLLRNEFRILDKYQIIDELKIEKYIFIGQMVRIKKCYWG